MSRIHTPTTGLSCSLSLDLLICYIDNVLSAIIDWSIGRKIIESGTELRDLVQPVASDFSRLFDGISEGAKMFSDQKFLKSQLSTDAHSVAVDVLKGLGSAHWIAVGLLAILECMCEAAKLIVSVAILCCSFITSNKLSKFLLTKKIRDELVYARGKVDSMKSDLMLQMQYLTFTTLTISNRPYNVTGGNEENNNLIIIEQPSSRESKDADGSTLGVDRFLKKQIPTLFGLQNSSIEFQDNEVKRATKGFTKDFVNVESLMLMKEIRTFPIEFKREELWRATKGFAKEIGSGGFGNVYYGILSDGKRVAIKMPSPENGQGNREWMNELRTLPKLHHRNISELVGYCFEDNMLVYDYLPRDLKNTIWQVEKCLSFTSSDFNPSLEGFFPIY